MDANGNSGGVAPLTYNITDGQGSGCYSKQNTTLRIYANVTQNLATCEPWGIQIVGGVPPYNITINSPNQGTWTNMSLPEGFDMLTYIDRTSPQSFIFGK